ncbi:MAG: hypothetical protein QOF78_4149 [Phycisphaerales bacterium]|jgi:hypothetical protein|nr:hypothetical protein [Phycisphaerales bacterium]
MLTTEEVFDRMMELSAGNPNVLFDLDALGGHPSVPSIRALTVQGRVDASLIGRWRLTVHAIGATAMSSSEEEAKFIADVESMLAPNQGWFKVKALVTQKGWTFPTAIATALSLVRQDRLEEGSLGNFRLLEPEPEHT